MKGYENEASILLSKKLRQDREEAKELLEFYYSVKNSLGVFSTEAMKPTK